MAINVRGKRKFHSEHMKLFDAVCNFDANLMKEAFESSWFQQNKEQRIKELTSKDDDLAIPLLINCWHIVIDDNDFSGYDPNPAKRINEVRKGLAEITAVAAHYLGDLDIEYDLLAFTEKLGLETKANNPHKLMREIDDDLTHYWVHIISPAIRNDWELSYFADNHSSLFILETLVAYVIKFEFWEKLISRKMMG